MKKILVIEDEPQVRANISEILELGDFEPIVAKDGREGVQLAQENLPDLIVCDVMMPHLDGYGVLQVLRQEQTTDSIPFIFLTAKVDRSDFRQGMDLGADDYLTKPFTPDQLLGAIVTRLGKKASVERQAQQQMEELRNNLTQSLPHELNTPLNGIIGFANLLKECSDCLEPEEIEEMADGIQKSGERLYRVTQNFLLYSQLEMIATDPKRLSGIKNEDSNCLTESEVKKVALEAAKKAEREGDLNLELEDAWVPIADSYFRKVIAELLDNAFKFSPAGTPVQIRGTVKERKFYLYVRDRGRGMTPEQIASVGAYMQFERKLYEQQGSGLGLAIAKRLVELHDGAFKIESDGQGTIVSVVFPIVPK